VRISWWSNAPWTQTGYGTQTAQVVRRLAADGHDVSVSCNFGVHGQMLEWEGVPVYPGGMDAYSQDVIVSHATDWFRRGGTDAGLLVTLFDTWILKNERLPDLPLIASWVPIDHMPCPPDVLDWCKRDNVVPIAMSKHGRAMLAEAGVDCEYVPHAVEGWAKPTTTLPSGRDPRELLDIPRGAFVVMVNGANKGVLPVRKAFGEMLMAFSVFARDHDDAILYLHTDVSPGTGGVDLMRLAAACGIPADKIRSVDQYAQRMGIAQEMLAAFYTMADVLLSTSMGEGFGIPVIEAQACGTRVIVSDWTAQPELVGDGWVAECQPYWDEPQRAWFCVPLVPSIVDSLEAAYKAPRGVSHKAVRAMDAYRADTVFTEHWRPILGRLAERLAAA